MTISFWRAARDALLRPRCRTLVRLRSLIPAGNRNRLSSFRTDEFQDLLSVELLNREIVDRDICDIQLPHLGGTHSVGTFAEEATGAGGWYFGAAMHLLFVRNAG